MPKRIYTTEDYVQFFRDGEEAGFDYFFKEYYTSLSYYGCLLVKDRTVAQDLATEAFLKIWDRRSQFTDARAIKAYLFTIVRNDAFNYLAKQKRVAQSQSEMAAPDSEEAHLDHMIRAEVMCELRSAIAALAPECSRVMGLLYVEGKSVREVAQELGLAKSTVKSQKYRGLKILKGRLSLD